MIGAGRLADPETHRRGHAGAAGRRAGSRRRNRADHRRPDASSRSIRCAISAIAPAARWDTRWREAALRRGARVILVSGPTALQPPAAAETIFVETAQQMRTAVLDRWEQTSLIIMAAAVADYHVEDGVGGEDQAQRADGAGTGAEPDILADLGSLRHATGQRSPMLIGFAAETENLLDNARAKLTQEARGRHRAERCFAPGHRLQLRPQRRHHRHRRRDHRDSRSQQVRRRAAKFWMRCCACVGSAPALPRPHRHRESFSRFFLSAAVIDLLPDATRSQSEIRAARSPRLLSRAGYRPDSIAARPTTTLGATAPE